MSDTPLKGREVIFELNSLGPLVRVTAIDTKTMTEIVMQGPLSAGEATLKLNAARRLEYVLKKKNLI